MEILKNLSTQLMPFNFIDVITSLTVTTVLSLIIACVYILTHKRRGYDQDLIQTLIFLSVVVASVMLVIGNNIVGAFGLVGAVSIIRFRTRLENPQDTAFIFFEMAVGLSCGLKQYSIAGITTLFICVILLIFWKSDFAKTINPQNGNLLSVRVPDVLSGRRILEDTFNGNVKTWDIVSIHTIDDRKAIIDYRIVLKENVSSQSYIQELFSAVQGQLVILRFETV